MRQAGTKQTCHAVVHLWLLPSATSDVTPLCLGASAGEGKAPPRCAQQLFAPECHLEQHMPQPEMQGQSRFWVEAGGSSAGAAEVSAGSATGAG